MPPHYVALRQRFRERIARGGLANFAEYEVIELVLKLATRSEVKPQRDTPSTARP